VLVFINESGDGGLKFDWGSSDLFVCAAVVFSDAVSADACDQATNCLRCKLQKTACFEFHFSHCSGRIREAFLNTVNRQAFQYVGFAVDKRKLYGVGFTEPKEIYRFAVSIVCEQIRPLLNNSKIVIDKNGDRAFRLGLEKEMKLQMTNQDGSCQIKKVTMEASHSNNLIQLVDMVCGSIARSCAHQDDRFRDLIRRRARFVQAWPP
jgi:Protein of unknown function (DUF3800)